MSSEKFVIDIEKIAFEAITLKDPPKTNKATISKMIIADPGLLLEMQFVAELDITKIEIIYSADVPNNDEDYTKVFTAFIDGGDKKLDLKCLYYFVVPFIYEDFKGSVEKIDYKIEINYYKYGSDHSLISLGPVEDEIVLTGNSTPTYNLFNPNHIFKQEITGTDYSKIKEKFSEGNGFKYGKCIFQEQGYGISGSLTYPTINAGFTTAISNTDDSLVGVETRLIIEHDTSKEFVRDFYLPYPRLQGSDNNSNIPKNYHLNLGQQAIYGPDDDFSSYKDIMRFGLLNHPQPS